MNTENIPQVVTGSRWQIGDFNATVTAVNRKGRGYTIHYDWRLDLPGGNAAGSVSESKTKFLKAAKPL